MRYIEGDFTEIEKKEWLENFEVEPEPLTQQEKDEFLTTLTGVSLTSDAFFPFRDGVDEAASAGVTAIIQPGGSIRDQEVIDAANEHGMAMVFTGCRVFRH